MVASLSPNPSVSFWLLLRFFSFFKGALCQNSNKIVEIELLIFEVQQLEDFFRFVHTNLRAWFNIFVLGVADFSTERSKYDV